MHVEIVGCESPAGAKGVCVVCMEREVAAPAARRKHPCDKRERHAPREAKSSWPFLMSLRVALFAHLAICVVCVCVYVGVG